MRSTNEAESHLDLRSERLAQAYDPSEFTQHGTKAIELIREHLDVARGGGGSVWPGTSPDEMLARWPSPEGAPTQSFELLMKSVLEGSTHQHHPGFVGQQLSVVPPVVGASAMVGAVLNNSAAIFEGAPVGIAIERQLVNWMISKVGYPSTAGGALTSGGSLGALTALLAMRQTRTSDDVWKNGFRGSQHYAILVSRESHYCNRRACAILGFGECSVMTVDTNERFAITAQTLSAAARAARKLGLKPLAVVANAASTATGAYDNLNTVADFCADNDLWLHVDAAHGGSALLSEKYCDLLRGIDRADSLVWDAHKMMLMPSNCTAVLFRDRQNLERAFRQEGSYLFSEGQSQWYEPAASNFEATKPTFAVPLYLSLRMLGTGFFGEYVDYAYDLARAFADEILSRSSLELLASPESNIVCFRVIRDVQDLDSLQLTVRDSVNRSGRFFLMRTRVNGAMWLRVVLMNPMTRLRHLRTLLEEVERNADGTCLS